MFFWIIFFGLSIAYWIVRAIQCSGASVLKQGIEQAFFCALLLFILSFFGIPMLDFKTGDLVEPGDMGYSKLRFGAVLLLCIVTPLHFFLVLFENRKFEHENGNNYQEKGDS